jgi:hypothetical protein
MRPARRPPGRSRGGAAELPPPARTAHGANRVRTVAASGKAEQLPRRAAVHNAARRDFLTRPVDENALARSPNYGALITIR